MTRYIQQDNRKAPEPKKEKPREMTKPGQYTMEQLYDIKPIVTPNGGKR